MVAVLTTIMLDTTADFSHYAASEPAFDAQFGV